MNRRDWLTGQVDRASRGHRLAAVGAVLVAGLALIVFGGPAGSPLVVLGTLLVGVVGIALLVAIAVGALR